MEQVVNFDHIPNLPQNENGPLFAEPWQLTAFGIVLELHKNGYFQWREWVNYLSSEIALGKDYGASDHNGIYYHQWLAALEKLVTDKKLSTFEEIVARKEQWRFADEHREFGQPLSLHGHDRAGHRHHHDHDHHHDHIVDAGEHACRPAASKVSETMHH